MKRFILLAAVLGCFALNLAAQSPSVDPLTGLPIAKPDNGIRFNMEFSGGSPGDLIEAIQKTIKERPNIIIHPDCASISIPPFRLRDVTVNQVFNTLNTLSEPNFEMGYWRQVPLSDNDVWILSKNAPAFGTPGMGIPPRGGFAGNVAFPSPDRTCRIFNLGPFLETFNVEDITTAIQGAWELMKSDLNQSIKYHKDTKLLIVVGGKEELRVVDEVLMQLRTSLLKPAPAPAPAQIPAIEPAKPAAKP